MTGRAHTSGSGRDRIVHVVLGDGDRFTSTTATDRRMVFGGEGGPSEHSPMETILACLASCSAMDVISVALKKRQNVERYEVHAVGHQRNAYPQILTEVTITHQVWGRDIDEDAIRRCIELSALTYCPVNAMLSAGDTAIHHRFLIRSTGDAPYEAGGEVLTTGPYRRPDVVRG